MSRIIPDILIEQAALGELSQEKMDELRKECDLDALIAEIQASNREILNKYPPAEIAGRIKSGGQIQLEKKRPPAAEEKKPRRILQGVFRVGLPMAAAAALFIAVGLPAMRSGGSLSDDAGAMGVRLKGQEPEIKVYRQTSGGAEELQNEDTVHENDLLQVSYIAAGSKYGVILSIDGSGAVTLHHPGGVIGDQQLAKGGEYALPFSYQLDDAPRFERFYFISGSEEIPMDLLMSEAERVAMSRTGLWAETFHLPDQFRQESLLLLKGSR